MESIEGFSILLDGTEKHFASASDVSFVFYGLTSETQYNVQVVGVLEADSTAQKLTSSTIQVETLATTAPVAPPQPTVEEIGIDFIKLKISLPSDTGGEALTSLVIHIYSEK